MRVFVLGLLTVVESGRSISKSAPPRGANRGWATPRVLSEGIPDAVLVRSLHVSALCLRHDINSASCTFKNIDQTPVIF